MTKVVVAQLRGLVDGYAAGPSMHFFLRNQRASSPSDGSSRRTGEGSAAPSTERASHVPRALPSASRVDFQSRTRHGSTSSVKCVKACSKGSIASTSSASRPQSRASASPGRRAGIGLRQRPHPAPDARRRALLEQHLAAREHHQHRDALAPRGRSRTRRAGSSSTRFSMRATQSAFTGHRRQCGFLGRHTSAPRSIMPCVYASMPRAGRRASAALHSAARTDALDGSPPMPPWRASTRRTLPSRIARRSPAANAAIAPAVERPTPGSATRSATSPGRRRRGARPLRAPRDAGCAPLRSSPIRSRASSRRLRGLPPPARRRRESAQRSARSRG